MPNEGGRPCAAVVNTSEETAELLAALLEEAGYEPVTGYVVDFKRGRDDLREFLRRHDPRLIVWDIAIPYIENWTYFRAQEAEGALTGRAVILTTTNKEALESFVGPTSVCEIIGKPFDVQDFLDAVSRVAGPA